MSKRNDIRWVRVSLTAFVAVVGALASVHRAHASEDIIRLRSTGPGEEGLRNAVVTGTVTSVSSHGPVLRTRTGILNLRWDNLHAEDADKVGRKSGHFRVIDSRHTVMGNRGFELDLYIVSRQDEANRTNHLVMARTVEQ